MSDRKILPNRRQGETFEIRHRGQRTPFVITLGKYENGMVGEVFIAGSKSGSEFDAVARDGAILLSLALQHGVPIETMKHAMTREPDSSASSIIGAVVDLLQKANET
jgi:hypothetical protein